MDETDSLDPELNNKSDEWKLWTPEELLPTLLHEFRNPIMILKGWVGILSDEKAKELHPKAIEGISQAVGKLEDVYGDMANYYREFMKKS